MSVGIFSGLWRATHRVLAPPYPNPYTAAAQSQAFQDYRLFNQFDEILRGEMPTQMRLLAESERASAAAGVRTALAQLQDGDAVPQVLQAFLAQPASTWSAFIGPVATP